MQSGATEATSALYAKLTTALFLKTLQQVVDSTAGDVVQLVRTLPCRWLESYTVTADRFYPALLACFLRLLAVHSHILRRIRADLTIVFTGTTVSKRVIALWLASKLLTTKGAVRLDLDSLGTVGSVLG